MNQILSEFDWNRAADLTLCKPETLRNNAEKDMIEVARQARENGKGAAIITHYQPFAMEVASRLTGPDWKHVALTIKLIAVRAAGVVELDA